MIIVDTSALLAALNPDQPEHGSAAEALNAESGPFVLSPFVLAEVDYFLGTYGRPGAQARFLKEVLAGLYWLAPFTSDELPGALEVITQYADLRVGLADASIVALAGKLETDRVLTLDERHFRAFRTPIGDPFVVLPADA